MTEQELIGWQVGFLMGFASFPVALCIVCWGIDRLLVLVEQARSRKASLMNKREQKRDDLKRNYPYHLMRRSEGVWEAMNREYQPLCEIEIPDDIARSLHESQRGEQRFERKEVWLYNDGCSPWNGPVSRKRYIEKERLLATYPVRPLDPKPRPGGVYREAWTRSEDWPNNWVQPERSEAAKMFAKARRERGQTQLGLAVDLECSKHTVIAIEYGNLIPGRALAERIFQWLGVPMEMWPQKKLRKKDSK